MMAAVEGDTLQSQLEARYRDTVVKRRARITNSSRHATAMRFYERAQKAFANRYHDWYAYEIFF